MRFAQLGGTDGYISDLEFVHGFVDGGFLKPRARAFHLARVPKLSSARSQIAWDTCPRFSSMSCYSALWEPFSLPGSGSKAPKSLRTVFRLLLSVNAMFKHFKSMAGLCPALYSE